MSRTFKSLVASSLFLTLCLLPSLASARGAPDLRNSNYGDTEDQDLAYVDYYGNHGMQGGYRYLGGDGDHPQTWGGYDAYGYDGLQGYDGHWNGGDGWGSHGNYHGGYYNDGPGYYNSSYNYPGYSEYNNYPSGGYYDRYLNSEYYESSFPTAYGSYDGSGMGAGVYFNPR